MTDFSKTVTRRNALNASAALALVSFAGVAESQEDALADKRPDIRSLQSGDFLWPKRPGEFVPYNSGTSSQYDEEKIRWQDEKRVFIAHIRSDPNSTFEMRQYATDLDFMEFSDFLTLYQADQSPASPREYGGGTSVLYVGHVGIVAFEGNTPTVIEAVWGKGVQQVSYESWLKGRPGAWIWHSRLSNQPMERAKIADAARKYLGKPYNFWNFDLSDSTGFYCSKLCWLSTRDATGVAIDDNVNPRRGFWFSPKQMLKARRIDKLFSPGSYIF